MTDVAITAEGLGKLYRLGSRQRYRTLRDSLADTLTAPFRRSRKDSNGNAESFWALKDVSFEVKRGEVVGIIGRNGAGKSTLLKILSRITMPTEGEARIHGRIASLLEVGTGFHPELTGRENIYLNGAILGMKKAEIQRKFDEIVAFAEIDRFIDTPVKHYSSGMYVRLAFAVAAHLEPEILVVDEVLAVGDAQFQKKCLGKMSSVAQQGRTVIFVSHNMAALSQLTQRCILLTAGRRDFEGSTHAAIERYLGGEANDPDVYQVGKHGRRLACVPGVAEFVAFELRDHQNKMVGATSDVVVWITVRGREDIPAFRISVVIYRSDGTPVGGTFGSESLSLEKNETAVFEFRMKNLQLAPGTFVCGFGLGKGNPKNGFTEYDVVLDVVHFQILPQAGEFGTIAGWDNAWGSVRLPKPECEKISVAAIA